MPEHRQPHPHATCGFCLRPNIIRSKPREEYDGAETIKPWGSYSMCPIIRAKD